jgi:hypothetical protein
MERQRAIRPIVVGLALAVIAYVARHPIGDLWYETVWFGSNFFYRGWAALAACLVALLGLYRLVSLPDDPRDSQPRR